MPDDPQPADEAEPDAQDSAYRPAVAGAGRRPSLLVAALALVFLEALALAALAVLIVVETLSGPAPDRVTMISLAAVLLGLGVLLGAGARALWQGKRWGRGPVVTWQLLQFVIGVSAFGADEWWGTVLPAVVAAAALVGVLAPASRAATDGRGQPQAVL